MLYSILFPPQNKTHKNQMEWKQKQEKQRKNSEKRQPQKLCDIVQKTYGKTTPVFFSSFFSSHY